MLILAFLVVVVVVVVQSCQEEEDEAGVNMWPKGILANLQTLASTAKLYN